MTSSYFTTMLLKKLLTSSINLQCTPIKVHLFLFLILCDFNPWNACYWRLFPTFKYNFWTQFLVLGAYLKPFWNKFYALQQFFWSLTLNSDKTTGDLKKTSKKFISNVHTYLAFFTSWPLNYLFFCTFLFQIVEKKKGLKMILL